MEGFDYVLKIPEPPKVGFGKAIDCKRCLTSFTCRYYREVCEFPGPFEYGTDYGTVGTKKIASNLGYNCFVSRTVREPIAKESPYPPIGTYDYDLNKKVTPSKAPFDSSTKRFGEITQKVPGPGTHPAHLKRPDPDISTAFNSHRILWPVCAVFCSSRNNAICHFCKREPIGDYYYNFDESKVMCRPCRFIKCHFIKKCRTNFLERIRQKREIAKYKPARHCGFLHDHCNTKFSIQTLPTNDYIAKIRGENYLFPYFYYQPI